jgi:predicted Zn-dependent protease with MMP-like domain
VNRGEFRRLVRDALDGIPDEFAHYLTNVAVVIEDEPSPGQLRRAGLDPHHDTLYGLYQGVPLPDRPHDFAGLPDQITIFRRPLERACRTRATLRREIQVTVVHEIAHFFGIDDQRVRELGY